MEGEQEIKADPVPVAPRALRLRTEPCEGPEEKLVPSRPGSASSMARAAFANLGVVDAPPSPRQLDADSYRANSEMWETPRVNAYDEDLRKGGWSGARAFDDLANNHIHQEEEEQTEDHACDPSYPDFEDLGGAEINLRAYEKETRQLKEGLKRYEDIEKRCVEESVTFSKGNAEEVYYLRQLIKGREESERSDRADVDGKFLLAPRFEELNSDTDSIDSSADMFSAKDFDGFFDFGHAGEEISAVSDASGSGDEEGETAQAADKRVFISYTNWRGERRVRHIEPQRMFFGASEYHPGLQWLIQATDCETGEMRLFAWAGVHSVSVAPPAAEE